MSDYQSLTSPGSGEVSSDIVILTNGAADHHRHGIGSSGSQVSHALKQLEEQLSLNDDTLQDFGSHVEDLKASSELMGYNKEEVFNRDQLADFRETQNVSQNDYYGGFLGLQG